MVNFYRLRFQCYVVAMLYLCHFFFVRLFAEYFSLYFYFWCLRNFSFRLFVRNLPYTCKENDLRFLFEKYGEVAEVHVLINKKTNQCKGFAIVTFVFPEDAVVAYSALDGTIFKVSGKLKLFLGLFFF